METKILTSKALSQILFMPSTSEPDRGSVEAACKSGIFIGNSSIYSLPVFLDPDGLLNPHMLIVGMTGSGKTFLMKSLIMRLSVIREDAIVLLDFSGEYRDILADYAVSPGDFQRRTPGAHGISYIDFSKMGERTKVIESSAILSSCLALMRRRTTSACASRMFIVLDEAWKLLKSEKGLETIVREGRKYGVGLILASQLVADADAQVLSNIATLFLFRTQDRKSLERVAKNYGISDKCISSALELPQGSCIIVQVFKSNSRSVFTVKQVIGLAPCKAIMVKKGNSMGIEVDLNRLEAVATSLCKDAAGDIVQQARGQGSITLAELIRQLIIHGAPAGQVLREMRTLGFDDASLSDAFSIARCEVGDAHGSR